jgi:DNA-binding MarR family transcriptional regulator
MTAQAQQTTVPQRPPGTAELLPALDQVFAETVALVQRLRVVAPLMHTHEELERDQCTVLQTLDRDGSRTVADIGEDCGITRNQAQKLVKVLQKMDLVEMVDNPENKRAKLVELTEAGSEAVRALEAREIELLTSLPLAATPADLRAAATALAAVRNAFGDATWQKLLNNRNGNGK